MSKAWVGVDAGKGQHWALAIDVEGQTLRSRPVANDQTAISELLAEVSGLADELVWAVDLSNGCTALLLALLWANHQEVVYVPGRAVNRAADGYPREGKTDARDARVIADQARLRRDFAPLAPTPELVADLRVLTGYRQDLTGDRTRMVTRLRQHLTAIFPALERALDFTHLGPLVLVTRWQTPPGDPPGRRRGDHRLAARPPRPQGRHAGPHRPGRCRAADRAAARRAAHCPSQRRARR